MVVVQDPFFLFQMFINRLLDRDSFLTVPDCTEQKEASVFFFLLPPSHAVVIFKCHLTEELAGTLCVRSH